MMPGESLTFIQAIKDQDLPRLRQIPKTDLHCHGSLSMRKQDLENWAGVKIKNPPSVFPTFLSFIRYIKEHIHPHTDHRHGFEFCLEAAVNQAINDGVQYTEMSLDLKFIPFYDSISDFIAYIKSIIEKYKKSISLRPEIGIKRTIAFKKELDVVYELIDSGYFYSLDLYDDEMVMDLDDFIPIYEYAKSKGLILKAHAGEYNTASSIAKTVELLNLDAIQHGINSIQDRGVVNMLREAQIPLHICPTSNVALKRTNSFLTHPIRELFDLGLVVTINTDDIVLFNRSVSEEFMNLYNHNVFSANELDQIRKNGLLQKKVNFG